MKTARLYAAFVTVFCPYCAEPQTCEYGDAYETIDLHSGTVWDCDQCGKAFKIPRYLPAIDLKGTPTR